MPNQLLPLISTTEKIHPFFDGQVNTSSLVGKMTNEYTCLSQSIGVQVSWKYS